MDALSVPLQGQHPPQDQLVDYLRGRELLLVLDNFEHLAADAGVLAGLLQAAPGLTLLVTSQTRLALHAEWLFPLDGLSCPPETARQATTVDLMHYDAARLLIQHIQQLQVEPALTDRDAQAIATICHLAAGMPLAIELAAAAIHGRSLQEVTAALTENMDLLEACWQDAPNRHTSMRASLEHAGHLLLPDEHHVFIRLAVFRGGFQADAAFEVAGATLPVLRALVDKSLLRRDETGRYHLYKPVRPFAVEKLSAAGLAEETALRHLLYFVTLAETVEPHLRSAEQAFWMQRLELEQDNLRAALQWALAGEEYTLAARLGGALWLFWLRGGHLAEGRAWLEAALAHQAASKPAVRAQLDDRAFAAAWAEGKQWALEQAVADVMDRYAVSGDGLQLG